jgi:hypothetical protein
MHSNRAKSEKVHTIFISPTGMAGSALRHIAGFCSEIWRLGADLSVAPTGSLFPSSFYNSLQIS